MSKKSIVGMFFVITLVLLIVFNPLNVFANDVKEASSDVASKSLEVRVKEALREHKDVKAEIKGEDVILRGHVNTQNEKNILEKQIRGVSGVRYVRDEVKVKHSKLDAAEDYVEDSAITSKVKAEILVTKGLDSLDIHVKTTDGIVTLSGKVKHPAQVELAEKVARKNKGVKGVVNDLSVQR